MIISFLSRHLLAAFSALALAVLGASSAQAAVILSPGSLWEYDFVDPTGNASWNTTTGGWTTGLAPFGNTVGGDFGANTNWAADGADGDDLWVRTSFDLSGYDLGSVLWDLGVDNGFKLYVNGVLVAQDNAEGFTARWEYSGNFGGNLLPGVNVIAVALEDHGGLTAFDMQVTGRPRAARVPEGGSTLAMFSLGLAAMGLATRHLRRR